MIQTLSDLLSRLILETGLSGEEILRLLLLFALAFAGLHLLTMLVTRWGDTQATTKSLLFSVLAHCVFFSGVVLLQPVPPPLPPETEAPVEVTLVEADEANPQKQRGNTPDRNLQTRSDLTSLTRTPRIIREPEPLQTPERTAGPITPPELSRPDLPSLPAEPLATPQPQSMGLTGPRVQAQIPLKIDDPLAERRPEFVLPFASNVTRQQIRRGEQAEGTEAEPVRGSVEAPTTQPAPDREIATLDLPLTELAERKRAPSRTEVRPQLGPAPSSIPVETAGTVATARKEPDTGGAPDRPLRTRMKTRTFRGDESGTVERFRPGRVPSTPLPTTDRELAVRDGVATELNRPGPAPNVIRPNFEGVRRSDVKVPATYALRNSRKKADIARTFGGTDASERAVESGLQWLAAAQHADGYWDADAHGSGKVSVDEDGVDRRDAGKESDSGVTALAVLAFLGAGYTHEEGRYEGNVNRALVWLISQQQEDGFLGGKATHYARMYCHAMATYALAEAVGMQLDPSRESGFRKPLERAIGYILDNQNEDGGWRYVKGQKGDMSIFGWQLMALKSADIAGIPMPDSARNGMIRFLKERSLGEKNGLAGYREQMPASASMTAEALFCKQMLGMRRSNPSSSEAVSYLLARQPRLSEWNLYYWYYGTLAMFQYGGDAWKKWNESFRDLIITGQVQTGEHAGSWEPVRPWGPYGGRVYSTA
ncbi:MAG: hypothetical protein KDA79_13610, partial [Planctomycetaceae bacterium]|nr:hypothetical protein [Planctomycetaceae bacterium]